MKLLTNKVLSLLILLFAILAEYFHKLFDGIWHSNYVNPNNGDITPIYWSDIIYHFFNESLTLILIILVCIKLWTDRASKTIMSAIFGWFFVEWIEITLQMAKIIDIRTSTNSVSWLQLSTCLTIALLVSFTNKKSTS